MKLSLIYFILFTYNRFYRLRVKAYLEEAYK